jgi:hypothetical protein
MALNTVLRGMLSIFAVAIAFGSFMPAVFELVHQEKLWDGASDTAIKIRDNVYANFLAMPLFMIGAVLIWSYLSATKRDYAF